LGGIEVLNANELLEIVKGETKNLVLGEKWNRISRANHLILGILFLNHIKLTDIGGRSKIKC